MMVVDWNRQEQVKVSFNVNFKTLVMFNKKCICWYMNFIDIKMQGTMIKKIILRNWDQFVKQPP